MARLIKIFCGFLSLCFHILSLRHWVFPVYWITVVFPPFLCSVVIPFLLRIYSDPIFRYLLVMALCIAPVSGITTPLLARGLVYIDQRRGVGEIKCVILAQGMDGRRIHSCLFNNYYPLTLKKESFDLITLPPPILPVVAQSHYNQQSSPSFINFSPSYCVS